MSGGARKRSPVARGGRVLVRVLWALALLALAAVLVQRFVADVFRVTSGSMEPALFGGADEGESVLVRFQRSPGLQRFELVVVERPGQREPVVKRVAGLPGETVAVTGGDLVVDGHRLDWEAPRPALVPVYDAARVPLPDAFFFKRAPEGPWSAAGDTWAVDAREVERGSNSGMMLYGPDLRDSYERPDGTPDGGLHQVGDAILEVEFSAAAEGGRLRFNLVEEGDTFEAVLDWGPGGGTRLAFERWVADRPPAVLAERALTLAPEQWHAVRFANVDNSLVFERVGEGVLLAVPYTANQPYPAAVLGDDKSVGPRVAFGAEGLRARFRGVSILRDVHYTAQGEYGVGVPVTLGLDEYFLLGDNSADSRDSRFWGPVSAARIVGRPVAVIWPWNRRRALQGPRPIGPLALP